MMIKFRTIIIALVLLGWNIMIANAFACSEMNVLPLKTVQGSAVKITCKTNVEVKQIAIEISGRKWNASLPNLYDDGTHGDELSKDKTYTLLITAPPVSGNYKVKFFKILPDQTELKAGQLKFSVE